MNIERVVIVYSWEESEESYGNSVYQLILGTVRSMI